jgi:hypothetical protein
VTRARSALVVDFFLNLLSNLRYGVVRPEFPPFPTTGSGSTPNQLQSNCRCTYAVQMPEEEKTDCSTHELRVWRSTESELATARLRAFRDKQTLSERATRHYNAAIGAYDRFRVNRKDLPHITPAIWHAWRRNSRSRALSASHAPPTPARLNRPFMPSQSPTDSAAPGKSKLRRRSERLANSQIFPE